MLDIFPTEAHVVSIFLCRLARCAYIDVAVTAHPTADWIAQQLRNAFPDDQAPRDLAHDRDGAFAEVATTVAGMQVEAVRTA